MYALWRPEGEWKKERKEGRKRRTAYRRRPSERKSTKGWNHRKGKIKEARKTCSPENWATGITQKPVGKQGQREISTLGTDCILRGEESGEGPRKGLGGKTKTLFKRMTPAAERGTG